MIIKKPYYFIFLYLAFVLLLVLLTGCGNGQGLEIVVSNTEDSGEGALRQALEIAETGDTIIFDPEIFSPDDPATINIQSRLPALDQGSVTIDASNAGVILNGAFAGENDVNGLEILSSNNTIRGLQIINFQNGAGIALGTEAKDNLIGGDRGTGAGPCGQGNQLSANETGISLKGNSVTGNVITGNLIGTNENGQRPYRNIGNNNGITISNGASANTIGEDNIIAFNETYGVHILGNASERNTITRNSIFSNGAMAIYLEGGNAGLEAPVITEFNINNGTVKGSACAGCTVEVFSSNGREGKFFEGDVQTDEDGRFSFSGIRAQAPRFTVTVTDAEGNTSEFSTPTEVREIVVGSTEDSGEGTLRQALQEAEPGAIITFNPEVFPPGTPATIYLERELPVIHQGYLTLDASNAGVIIDGKNIQTEAYLPGLIIESSNNIIMGLQIINFKASPPGQGAGITIRDFAQDNVIGGDRSKGIGPIGQGNLLSKNDLGIDLAGSGASWNVITGNLIGTDISIENQDKQNGNLEGVIIDQGASKNIIGPGNVIAFNIRGVVIAGKSTLSNTITRNNIHNNWDMDIFLEGGNLGLSAPIILSVEMANGFMQGHTEPNSVVEVFSDDTNEGKIFETLGVADESGNFTIVAGRVDSLTATVTDTKGNTSSFSIPTVESLARLIIQADNDHQLNIIQTKKSSELEDNRIGSLWDIMESVWHRTECVKSDTEGFLSFIDQLGLKHARVILDHGDWHMVDWQRGYSTKPYLDPVQDHILSEFYNRGIETLCCLVYWDMESAGQDSSDPNYSRFRTEEEIIRYLDYVASIVDEIGDRVTYYEILNESNHWEGTQKYVKHHDYIKLIKRVVPVIKEVNPEARVVVGATAMVQSYGGAHLLELLRSEIMPLVDGVSFHPMYGVSPEHAVFKSYYNNYSRFLKDIKLIASENGFDGVFIADELTWRTDINPLSAEPWVYSRITATKYYARGILMHLGDDMIALFGGEQFERITPLVNIVRNLCTVMAGHEAIAMPVEINIDYSGPIAYCSFRYPNGDRMLAVWTDGVAVDEDPGVPATITFPGLTTDKVTGIDVLHGLEQDLVFTTDGETTVVKDVLVKDYPVLIRLNNPAMSSGYEETVGDGFHRLER